MWEEFDDVGVVKRTLNIRKLIETIVDTIMGFTDEHLPGKDGKPTNHYTDDERERIDAFEMACSDACDIFWDILNYNDNYLDGERKQPNVELIEITKDGKVVIGADIKAVLEDVQIAVDTVTDEVGKIDDAVKDAKDETNVITVVNVASQIFQLLSRVSVYFGTIVNPNDDTRYGETIEDFENFFAACKIAYDRFLAIKDIDHSKLFDEKEEEIVDFIIYICVVSLPVIDLCIERTKPLVNSSVEELNKLGPNAFIVTKADLQERIEKYYGKDGFTYILVAIDNFVDTFVAKYELKKKAGHARVWLKKHCCCCCK